MLYNYIMVLGVYVYSEDHEPAKFDHLTHTSYDLTCLHNTCLSLLLPPSGRVPTDGRRGFACYHANNRPRDICNNDVGK